MAAIDGARIGVPLQPDLIPIQQRGLNRFHPVNDFTRLVEEIQKPTQLIDMRAHLGGRADDTRRSQTVAERRAEGMYEPRA